MSTLTKEQLDSPGVLAMGSCTWGKGPDITTAMKNAGLRKTDRHILYAVPFAIKGIRVNEDGCICWKHDGPHVGKLPKQLHFEIHRHKC